MKSINPLKYIAVLLLGMLIVGLVSATIIIVLGVTDPAASSFISGAIGALGIISMIVLINRSLSAGRFKWLLKNGH